MAAQGLPTALPGLARFGLHTVALYAMHLAYLVSGVHGVLVRGVLQGCC